METSDEGRRMSAGAQAGEGGDALLSAWEMTLARKGDAPAVFDAQGEIVRSFREIESSARALQWALPARQERPIHAIELGNHPDWPAVLLACLRRGLTAMPVEVAAREAAQKILAAGATADWQGRPPALLKLTSGTSAAPRAIRFTSKQLLADCAQICETMGLTETDLNFGVIPLSHSYGFSNLLTPLLARGVPLVLSDDRMPRAVLDGLARTGATLFAGMPIFYQAFAGMERVPELPKLRLCISAGAPLPLAVAQKFREKFGHAIHSFYGSSECGGICYDREAALEEPGFVGRAMSGVELEMLEPDATASRIRVHSAAAGDDYFPEPDAEQLGGGCFIPDDLLLPTRNGFRIVGRITDIINVAGKKVNPAEVEEVLLRFAGVREAVVFGRGSVLRNEEVAACVVAEVSVTESDLLEHCRARLSGWQVPRRIFRLDEIPVTERGKISRRALAERFR